MKRIQLFEFEDFEWFPSWTRRSMTNLIALLHRMTGTAEVITDLIALVIREHRLNTIVDLGSGSGGIMPEVLGSLQKQCSITDIKLILTDLYPNQERIDNWNTAEGQKISYFPHAIDAAELDKAPEGLKTMINCFHHLPPDPARRVLDRASRKKEALLIYEMGENNIPLLIWWLLLPLSLTILFIMVWFMTPWVRPLGWQQLVFTYLIPIIPLCYAWDGQASLPRMYTMRDLDKLLNGLERRDYQWKKGRAYKRNKKKLGTYLIGLPIN